VSLPVRIISAGVHFVVSSKSGFEVVSINLSSAQYNTGRAHGGGYAIFIGKVIETSCYHDAVFINHDLWNLFERQGNPETVCSIFHVSDTSFDVWDMLVSCTDFDVCRYFLLQCLELVVSVDKVYFEAAIPENGKDLFYTIDNVLGSSFVRSMECFLLACADVIQSLSFVDLTLVDFMRRYGAPRTYIKSTSRLSDG